MPSLARVHTKAPAPAPANSPLPAGTGWLANLSRCLDPQRGSQAQQRRPSPSNSSSCFPCGGHIAKTNQDSHPTKDDDPRTNPERGPDTRWSISRPRPASHPGPPLPRRRPRSCPRSTARTQLMPSRLPPHRHVLDAPYESIPASCPTRRPALTQSPCPAQLSRGSSYGLRLR